MKQKYYNINGRLCVNVSFELVIMQHMELVEKLKGVIPHSLKVMFGYILGFLLMSGVVLINWHNSERMRSLVLSGERVSEFIDTTLEVRRYEKNLFLYGKE